MVPPVKMKLPEKVTFNEPVLLAPLPTVQSVTIPPVIVIPEVSPNTGNVPEAEL